MRCTGVSAVNCQTMCVVLIFTVSKSRDGTVEPGDFSPQPINFPKKVSDPHNFNSWTIWTLSKFFSFSVAYQKRLCVGDLYFHKYCFVRCNLSGDTGNQSPLALQECNPVFSPFLSTAHYYITCIMLQTPVGFQRNPLF